MLIGRQSVAGCDVHHCFVYRCRRRRRQPLDDTTWPSRRVTESQSRLFLYELLNRLFIGFSRSLIFFSVLLFVIWLRLVPCSRLATRQFLMARCKIFSSLHVQWRT